MGGIDRQPAVAKPDPGRCDRRDGRPGCGRLHPGGSGEGVRAADHGSGRVAEREDPHGEAEAVLDFFCTAAGLGKLRQRALGAHSDRLAAAGSDAGIAVDLHTVLDDRLTGIIDKQHLNSAGHGLAHHHVAVLLIFLKHIFKKRKLRHLGEHVLFLVGSARCPGLVNTILSLIENERYFERFPHPAGDVPQTVCAEQILLELREKTVERAINHAAEQRV